MSMSLIRSHADPEVRYLSLGVGVQSSFILKLHDSEPGTYYQWKTGDYSRQLMNQNPRGRNHKYVATTEDPAGLEGAWVRNDKAYAISLIKTQPYFGHESDVWIAPDPFPWWGR